MSNVIILGAGASYDAKIPLLSGFVDRMWELAVRGAYDGTRLSDDDLKLFKQAEDIRRGLNEYHGRAAFDDRNIEDILSLLTFNQLARERSSSRSLEVMTQAIARTIEICCTQRHSGYFETGYVKRSGSNYVEFWRQFFGDHVRGREPPTIISFNYDLVLERAFYEFWDQSIEIGPIALEDGPERFPKNLSLDFGRTGYRDDFNFELVQKVGHFANGTSKAYLRFKRLESVQSPTLVVDLLKLHGSLNFRSGKPEVSGAGWNPTVAHAKPLILPPMFNKNMSREIEEIWSKSLNRLREAKNVVIVGYSLPQTDTYMQYFLRSALGPNQNLDRITVYDPALFRAGGVGIAIEDRYKACLSPQFQRRVNFRPGWTREQRDDNGTFAAFVSDWGRFRGQLFY